MTKGLSSRQLSDPETQEQNRHSPKAPSSMFIHFLIAFSKVSACYSFHGTQ